MTPDATGIEAALAAGLAAHRALSVYGRSNAFVCSCNMGGLDTRSRTTYTEAEHRAHQAAALLPLVTQAQAEALREAAREIDRDHCVPPNIHQHPRSWSYRDGYFDGATHAAVALRRIARADERGI